MKVSLTTKELKNRNREKDVAFKKFIGVRTFFEDPPPCTLSYAFGVPPPPPSERTYFLNGPLFRLKYPF